MSLAGRFVRGIAGLFCWWWWRTSVLSLSLLALMPTGGVDAWSTVARQKFVLSSTLTSESTSGILRLQQRQRRRQRRECGVDDEGRHGLRVRGGADEPRRHVSYSTTVTQRTVLSAAATSLLAGSVAGAVGVGVAFPFDTLKTKAQVMETDAKMTISQVMREVYRQDGIAGFFGGVRGMMVGQAIIKSVAFSVNAVALAFLQQSFPDVAAPALLLAASCFSGFVTSFVVTPVERIKVMMQAAPPGTYANELDCLQAILRKEGWTGLFGRGLGPTLAREVPSYGMYFSIYGFLMQTDVATWLGSFAPLLFGAFSGCACWLPVYPIDVVKTVVQNTEGGDTSTWEVMSDLYKTGGMGAFFDGLTPKMIRAAINHAVTFYMYDQILSVLAPR